MSAPSLQPASQSAAAPWLHGRTVDLLLGAGLAYVVSMPALVLAARKWDIADWPVAAAALLALAFNVPHYGATILRAYDRREDRRRYALFSLWATVLLAGFFVASLYQPLLGSLLVTLYWSWSPWHFSGQNYGLAVMFLRRRRIPFDRLAKRLLYTSFLLSFALALLVVHVNFTSTTVWARPVPEEGAFRFLSLNLPFEAALWLAPVIVVAYLGCLLAVGVRLTRACRLAELAPVACLVLTQALWFLLPSALLVLRQKLPALVFTVIWVSAAHSIQYLWVSSYFARRESPSLRMPRYLGRSLLAGAAVLWFPGLVFAPGVLGSVPWTEGLAILLFSVVNLHHFVLDGAIWKLRDGRVARLLLRSAPEVDAVAEPRTGSGRWLRPILAAVGLVAVTVGVLDIWEREVGIRQASDDLPRIRQAAERLAWIGRAAPRLHAQIGAVLATRNQVSESVREFERSLALYPTADAWFGLGVVLGAQGEWSEARAALDEALALRPDDVNALIHSSRTWMRLARPDLARENLEHARALAPRNALIRRELQRAIAAAS